MTNKTAWLLGQIEGQEAAKGNVLPFNDLMIAVAAIEQATPCSPVIVATFRGSPA